MTNTAIEFAFIAFALMGASVPEAVALKKAQQKLLKLNHPEAAVTAARGEVEAKLKGWGGL